MNLSLSFKELWPIRFLFEKKTAQITLDKTTFKNDESMVITVWRWKLMKRVKFIARYNKDEGKFIIQELK